ATVKQSLEIMPLQAGKDAKLDVRHRADREGDLLLDQPFHQPIIFGAADAVVDASRVEEVKRLPDVTGRALLAGMRHSQQARLSRAIVNRSEGRRWVAHFRGIEADGEDPLLERPRLGEGVHRRLRAQVSQEAQDEPAGDLELVASILQGAMDTGDYGLERHTAIGVCLRIEEDLRVASALPGGPRQIGPGEGVEVLFLEQNAAAGVIDVEERLQIAEDV